LGLFSLEKRRFWGDFNTSGGLIRKMGTNVLAEPVVTGKG